MARSSRLSAACCATAAGFNAAVRRPFSLRFWIRICSAVPVTSRANHQQGFASRGETFRANGTSGPKIVDDLVCDEKMDRIEFSAGERFLAASRASKMKPVPLSSLCPGPSDATISAWPSVSHRRQQPSYICCEQAGRPPAEAATAESVGSPVPVCFAATNAGIERRAQREKGISESRPPGNTGSDQADAPRGTRSRAARPRRAPPSSELSVGIEQRFPVR